MKLRSIIFWIIIFFTLAPKCEAILPYREYRIALCYGSTYRMDNIYRHSFSVDNWISSVGCGLPGDKYNGFGASCEWTSTQNYNFGLRYFRSRKLGTHTLVPMLYVGMSSVFFSINDHRSVNTAPELGLYIPKSINNFGVSINIYYGYDISLSMWESYNLNRNRITVKIGFEFVNGKTDKRKNTTLLLEQ